MDYGLANIERFVEHQSLRFRSRVGASAIVNAAATCAVVRPPQAFAVEYQFMAFVLAS